MNLGAHCSDGISFAIYFILITLVLTTFIYGLKRDKYKFYNIILLHICNYLYNFLFTVMNKVEVGTLDMGELFEHRGVIYEVLYKTDYCVRCQYPNDKFRYRDIMNTIIKI